MIYGCKNWENRNIRYDQSNNIIESFLKKMKAAGFSTFQLESCNVEHAACLVEAVGGRWIVKKPDYMGYGDMFFDYLNSPFTAKKLPINDPKTPNNQIMENLAYVMTIFSDVETEVHHYKNSRTIDQAMEQLLKAESGIGLSYETGHGGHYIAVVAFDHNTDEFICYDSWKTNPLCKNGGIKERYSRRFFIEKARPRLMEVWK